MIELLLRSRSALALFIVGVLLLMGCRARDASLQRVEDAGLLRVGLDPTFPPFESAADGDLSGFDVELARLLAERLGVEAQFVFFGFDGLYDALATGQVDALLSALVVQPERTRLFAFSEPYFNAGEVLVVNETSTVGEMEQLGSGRVAVELGAQGHVVALEWQKRLPDLQIDPHNSAEEALQAVSRGVADAALVDSISAALFVKEAPGLRVADDAVTVEPFAIVVRIEDESLLDALNAALEELGQGGQLDSLRARWFGN